jgi:Na+(H+)/acetate symporter ActP
MATALGLGARALDLPLTAKEAGQGLVPPAVASHLMGAGGGSACPSTLQPGCSVQQPACGAVEHGWLRLSPHQIRHLPHLSLHCSALDSLTGGLCPAGAFLLVFQLFMAVTAAGSAEQIAVSSIVAYDVYRDYFNKKATGKQLVFVSRVMVVVYGFVSGALAVILLQLGLSLGWVYLFMGVCVGSAVLPIAFSITWKDCSAAGAISGCILGFIAALTSWLVSAKVLYGEINLDTTGGRRAGSV